MKIISLCDCVQRLFIWSCDHGRIAHNGVIVFVKHALLKSSNNRPKKGVMYNFLMNLIENNFLLRD